MSSPTPPPPPPADAWARLVPDDVDLDAGWRHEAAAVVWQGIVWGRLARGDLAVAHWDRVRLPALWPWIAAERGQILRELGLHAEAEALELLALAHAEDEVDAVMLRLSLVADAVGVGDVARATRRLRAATEAVAALPPLDATDRIAAGRAARQRLRWSWVAVEVALLTGQPVDEATGTLLPRWADDVARPVLPPELARGSVFHHAKALLFAGVVRDDDRLLEVAAGCAPPVIAWAVELARADRGHLGALDRARTRWRQVVPPPEVAARVAATPTARRLTGP